MRTNCKYRWEDTLQAPFINWADDPSIILTLSCLYVRESCHDLLLFSGNGNMTRNLQPCCYIEPLPTVLWAFVHVLSLGSWRWKNSLKLMFSTYIIGMLPFMGWQKRLRWIGVTVYWSLEGSCTGNLEQCWMMRAINYAEELKNLTPINNSIRTTNLEWHPWFQNSVFITKLVRMEFLGLGLVDQSVLACAQATL